MINLIVFAFILVFQIITKLSIMKYVSNIFQNKYKLYIKCYPCSNKKTIELLMYSCLS